MFVQEFDRLAIRFIKLLLVPRYHLHISLLFKCLIIVKELKLVGERGW